MTIAHRAPGNHLYHYTSAKTATLILDSRKLLFGSMQKVNDPKEFSDWRLEPVLNSADIKSRQVSIFNRKISHRCKEITQALCFSMDSLHSRNNGHAYYRSGCLGRGFGNSPMWHFYGEKHKGVCFAFNKNLLLEQLNSKTQGKFYRHGEICYDDEFLPNDHNHPYQYDLDRLLEIGLENYCYEFLKRSLEYIYFKKQTAWSYENEYRAIVVNDSANRFPLDYGSSLDSIIFGVNCSDKTKLAIRSIAEPKGVPCHDLIVINHTLQLNLQPDFSSIFKDVKQ
ncbi:DUF2971 domain-containing protein [Pseudomonas sp.]|uniref:DUF2971 domain-containing protein n=1 Tax=Pseudomonas sp. TaxID=306 RepID=UPI003BB81584